MSPSRNGTRAAERDRLERAVVGRLILEPGLVATAPDLLGLLSDEPRRVLAAAAQCPPREDGSVPMEALLGALKASGFDALGELLAPYLTSTAARDFAAAVARLRALVSEPAETPPRVEPRPRSQRDRGAQGSALELPDDKPATEAVDGATALDAVAATIRRFVVLGHDEVVAMTLWAALTYLIDAVNVLARLLIASVMKSCGKTRAIAVLWAIVRRPLSASSISPAALFRSIEAARPTLLLDEMDNARMNESPELRAVLNSGHTRGAAFTLRVVGDHHEVRRFSTWAPVAFACIGSLPDTVASRCIRVEMKRRNREEAVERLREHELRDELEPLRRDLARWALDHEERVRDADPDLPAGLADRDADNWAPLIAIADLAGGSWPAAARHAARATCGAAADEAGDRETLLADLRDLFDERGTDRLTSADVLAALTARDDRPWGEWSHGRPMTPRGLAVLLRPFGIEPRVIRVADRTPRGFHREQFSEAWTRYLPSTGAAQPQQRNEPHQQWPERTSADATPIGSLRIENATSPAAGAARCAVADEDPSGALYPTLEDSADDAGHLTTK